MSKRYDAIIIGAGVGGLTAAARLLKEGLRVLVVEADPHPGGTAYTYHRKGFGFPMGPLGFSSPELVRDILSQVGIGAPLALERVYYDLLAFGLRAPLSLPYPEMTSRLAVLFPSEEAGITAFFSRMRELASPPDRQEWGAGPRSSEMEPENAASYLGSFIEDWRLRRILGSMGSREPYAGMALLAAMWSLLCSKGIHYPAGGMRGLCDRLAGDLGWEAPPHGATSASVTLLNPEGPGSLMLRAEVSGVLVDSGKASGVVLADGTRIYSGAVISNADYKATFLRLVPRTDVPEGLYRAMSGARQTSSNLQVCLGLDASRVDLSAYDNASRVIYRRDSGDVPPEEESLDWDVPEIDPSALAAEELEATLLSADDPLLAPADKAVLVIRTAVPYRHFARFRPGKGRRLPGYFDYKTSLAGALVEEVSTFVPGLADAVLYMDVATPLTFEERGGRSEGAVAGWSWEYTEASETEALELIRTPVAALYMAGYQAYSMLALGGVPSAMLSGLKAAEYLVKGTGPVSSISIPGYTAT